MYARLLSLVALSVSKARMAMGKGEGQSGLARPIPLFATRYSHYSPPSQRLDQRHCARRRADFAFVNEVCKHFARRGLPLLSARPDARQVGWLFAFRPFVVTAQPRP